jgi:hypothetical protein
MSAQVRPDAVIVAAGCFLTSPDIGYPVTHHRAPGVVVLGDAGSNRFEVGVAVPQTSPHAGHDQALQFWAAEPRHAFAANTENAVPRVSNGSFRRDFPMQCGPVAGSRRSVRA